MPVKCQGNQIDLIIRYSSFISWQELDYITFGVSLSHCLLVCLFVFSNLLILTKTNTGGFLEKSWSLPTTVPAPFT